MDSRQSPATTRPFYGKPKSSIQALCERETMGVLQDTAQINPGVSLS
jgi:hypothetical protein